MSSMSEGGDLLRIAVWRKNSGCRGQFSVYRGGFVGMFKDIEVRNRSIRSRVFDGVF